MSLISQSIKNLKGGVSQQPDILRFSDQGELQINGFSSEVEGLQKRPPSVHVSRLAAKGSFGSEPYCHLINRDANEKYAVFFTGARGGLKIVNLVTGGIVGFSAQNPDYLQTDNPREDLRMVTVADYTFVLNRKKITAKGTVNTPTGYSAIGYSGLIVIRGGQYGKTYSIKINGSVQATFETPLGDKVEHAKQIDIKYILTKLSDGLKAKGWSVTIGSGYLVFEKTATEITSLEVEDGYNGKLAWGVINDVSSSTELPVYAPNNYIIRVKGSSNTGQDDYWVKFDSSRNVWTECAEPNITANYDVNNMPHILVRTASGSFEFKPANWTHRAAGDDDTNPFPSFIGSTINDIFFFRNRLGFLSGENVILSGSGDYFNFFPSSVAVLADSDPIDVAVSTNRISILKYAVPFSEELILWSDQAQFVLGSDGILSPTSVKLDLTTEFEITDQARPYGIGRGVYFVSPRAKYSSIRRFYAVQDVTQVKNAEDISAHIPSYIPNGVFKMTGSSTENFLSVLTEGAASRVYFYKFLYLQENLVQQSWSYWEFGGGVKVLCAEMIGAVLHLILDTPSGIFLERIEFTQNTKDYQDEPYRLYIDRKKRYVIPAGKYNDDTFQTTIKLKDIYGDTPKFGTYYAVTQGGVTFDFPAPTGGWLTNDGALVFDGDMTGVTIFIGEQYQFKYIFSKFLIKNTDTQGGVSTEDIGRLQLRRAWVNYNNSGNFRIEVNNQGRIFTYNMTGNRLSTNELILGDESLDSGQFKYPVSGDAKKVQISLISDTPNPLSIIGGGWEGNYVRRSSGI